MKLLRTTLAGLALATGIAAQDLEITIPAGVGVHVQMDGPGKMRDDFGETRLGALLSGRRLATLIGPMQMGIQMGLQQASSETAADVRGLYESILDYRGRIHVAWDFLGEVSIDEAPANGLVVILESDGETDFDEWLDAFAEMAEDFAPPGEGVVDEDVDGVALRVIQLPNGFVSMPQRSGERLVMFAGTSLEGVVRHFTNPDHDSVASSEGPNSLELKVNGARFGSLIQDFAIADAERTGEAPAEAVEAIFEAVGLTGLGDVHVEVRASDEHAVVQGSVQFDEEASGLLGLYEPRTTGRPSTLDTMTYEADIWSVTNFRFDKLLDLVESVFPAFEAETGQTWADIERAYEENTGTRLREDFVDHLGSQVVALLDVDYITAAMADSADAVCYGIETTNPAALEDTIQTIIQTAGMAEMLDREDYKGYQIRMLEDGDDVLGMVITDRLAMLALGDVGLAHMRSLLDREIALRDGGDVLEMPAPITDRLTHAIDGWDSISALRLPPMVAAGMEIAGMFTAVPDPARRAVDNVLAGLQDNDLEEVVFVGRGSSDRMVWQAIW